MGRAPARIAAVIHGCCKVSRRLPVPATATVRTPALAVRQNPKQSILVVTAIAMARGNSILHRSIGVKITAGIAEQRTTTTLRTA